MDFYLLSDTEKAVRGVAIVSSSFRGFIHRHAAKEIYFLLKGQGVLHVDGRNVCLKRGDRIEIPSNVSHAFISTGKRPARLYFELERGPLRSIAYEYGLGAMRPARLDIPPYAMVSKTRLVLQSK